MYCVADGVQTTASGDASFSIASPLGESLGTGTASPTTSGGVSYYDFAVPAIGDLFEGCRLTAVWPDSGSVSRTSVVFFDVVTSPWSDVARPTLADLRAIRPDVHLEFDRVGVLSGYAQGATAQNAACSAFTSEARGELDRMLRARATEDAQIRPALILDRDRLFPIECLLTLALLYESIAENPNPVDDDAGDGSSDSLARYYRKRAQSAFTDLRCVYDVDQDLVSDGPPKGPAVGSIRVRRV